MIINADTLAGVFKGYRAIFNGAFGDAQSYHDMIAMRVPSSTGEEVYGWLGQFPQMREWISDRHIKNLQAHGFSIKNKKFESTVAVPRDAISDDKIGLYKPAFAEMGRIAKVHPDTVVFDLLKRGFTTNCYDGQYFFDTEHPLTIEDVETGISNMQAGAGPAWFLLDTSRQIRPLIWQEREDYQFQTVDSDNNERVFLKDEYLYGVRARANAGFGLWQLAFASKADLTPANFAAARSAMMALRGDEGHLLGIVPTLLVVPPSLETAARTLVYADEIDGTSNIWKGAVELIVTPYAAE